MSSINYWKEIENEINSILNKTEGIILLTHNSIEFVDILDFINKIQTKQKTNILYISFIRSYGYMKSTLFQKKLENKNISFIDCVSGYAFPDEENIDECFYHKPPTNLEEMKNIIEFGIKKTKPDLIIIDSLSQFINFSKPTEGELYLLYNFLTELRNSFNKDRKSSFILLYDSKMGVMKKLPKTETDLILKIEIAKEEKQKIYDNNVIKTNYF